MEISLEQMLAARDARVQRQQALLSQWDKPLICFTMNIPGPVKNSPLITWGFHYGKSLLNAQLSGEKLPVLHYEQALEATGCLGFWVVDAPAEKLKMLTCQIEDTLPVGRLFDMDILSPGGEKMQREAISLSQRKCLLCDNPAMVCGSRRAHTVEELFAKTTALLQEAKAACFRDRVSALAVQSLLYEVCTTPKPGLVDIADNGSHKDMDLFTFLSSAPALGPYFAQCCRIGQETAHLPPQEAFQALRFPGKVAEAQMYRATGGVNTHKGAIFSLGLLCAAAGRTDSNQPQTILAECARMTQGLVDRELAPCLDSTAGQRLYTAHRITGIRGQAEAGFPVVEQTGLPLLQAGLSQGLSLNDAGCAVLMHLMTAAQDTNLVNRGGMDRWQRLREELTAFLAQHPFPTPALLRPWNDRFIEENLSPGGSADLLTLTYFLYFLEKEC